MADLKISQLSDGGASQAADEYVVARSGSNFRIDGASVAAAATSVGTLTSLTVSGDLTVDTNTLYVKSSANQVGIGTTSPLGTLGIVGSATTTIIIPRSSNGTTASPVETQLIGSTFTNGTYEAGVYALNSFTDTSANWLAFKTTAAGGSPTTKMTIDGNGRVGIGTASPQGALSVSNGTIFVGSEANTSQQNNLLNGYGYRIGTTLYGNVGIRSTYENAGNSANLEFYTAASGTNTAKVMELDKSGNLGLGVTPVAKLDVNGTIYSRTGGVYTDSITSYGGSSLAINAGSSNLNITVNGTERARITSGGYFKASNDGTYVDATGAYHEIRTNQSDNTLYVTNKAASNPYGILMTFTAASPNDSTRYFFSAVDSTTVRARIYSNGGLANYQSNNSDLSDARTKTDITPLNSMWDRVAALEIVSYKYIDQTHDDVNLGVIAQQVETVEPVWVDSDGFGDTPEGEEPMKTVYNKDITFAAIKALQEAMTRIEALEVEVAALKAGA